MEIRKELIKARQNRGLTQGEVARAVGIDRTVYNRIERGKNKPSVDVALRIARLLGKRVEDIFLPEDVHQIHKLSPDVAGTGTDG